MATLAELQDALQNADKAGDVDAARQLADAIVSMRGRAPAVVPDAPKPSKNNNLAGSLGLTARAGLQAAGGFVGMFTDPIAGVLNTASGSTGPKASTARGLATQAADFIGLPSPDTPLQRIAVGGAEMMAGGGGAAGLSSKAAQYAGPAAKAVLSRLGAEPGMQIAAAGAGGVAGQQAKESGAGPFGEFVSAMAGTVLGGGAVAGGRNVINAAKRMLPQPQQLTQRIDQTINVTLQGQGVDPATITPAMRSYLRENVRKAMDLGPLNTDALGRLADHTRLGLTPTRSRLTLDPFDVTQEMNASKLAAATGSRDALLPTVANDNNRKMLAAVDDFGPIADSFSTGQRAMAPVAGRNSSMEAGKNALYKAAEDKAGGDIPLARGPVLNSIFDKLEKSGRIRWVPAEVMDTLKALGADTRSPFNVKTIDDLKTLIATEMRGTQNGNAKFVLGIIRDSLDSVPLEPIKKQFGGSQLVTEQGAKFLRNQDALAGELKGMLDKARGANFAWRQWQRSAPGIEAVVNDANPATFVQNFVRSKAADPRDVEKLANVINTNPGARQAVRAELVQLMKDGAIGKGNQSSTGNFSGRGWNAVLSDVGDYKLRLFFDPAEIETLKALGRAGTVEVFQPRGGAVNNSNTAAGIGGLLQGISKMLSPVANKLPLGQAVITAPLDNTTAWLLGRQATNVPNALTLKPQAPRNALDPLLLPALLGGNSLAQRP